MVTEIIAEAYEIDKFRFSGDEHASISYPRSSEATNATITVAFMARCDGPKQVNGCQAKRS